MPEMKLSTLAVILGLVLAVFNGYGFLKPAAFAAAARKFPRYTPVGVVLTLLATVWFLYNLSLESVSDFISFKPALFGLFAAVGLGTCIFVRDYLPVRGLAVVALLLAKLMVDTARWVDTPWRLVIVIWAYVMVLGGMWFTISPWRLRDLINWSTANEKRTRLSCGMRLAFGVFVILLGLTAFRAAEQKGPTPVDASSFAPLRAPIVAIPA